MEDTNKRINEWFEENKNLFAGYKLNMDAVTSIAIMHTELGLKMNSSQIALVHGMLSGLWEKSRAYDELITK
jgi:hypothetical protein